MNKQGVTELIPADYIEIHQLYAPVATSNSSTRGRVKLLHPWQRDEGTLFG